jgi:CheY-like chemotaxis protein
MAGYEVNHALVSGAALRNFAVFDVRLPGSNGIADAELLRQALPLPIVFLTVRSIARRRLSASRTLPNQFTLAS